MVISAAREWSVVCSGCILTQLVAPILKLGMTYLAFEYEISPVQLRRECEELYLSWWLQSTTSACTIRAIGLWGSLHHKVNAEPLILPICWEQNTSARGCCSLAAITKNFLRTALWEAPLFQNWNFILWNKDNFHFHLCFQYETPASVEISR